MFDSEGIYRSNVVLTKNDGKMGCCVYNGQLVTRLTVNMEDEHFRLTRRERELLVRIVRMFSLVKYKDVFLGCDYKDGLNICFRGCDVRRCYLLTYIRGWMKFGVKFTNDVKYRKYYSDINLTDKEIANVNTYIANYMVYEDLYGKDMLKYIS